MNKLIDYTLCMKYVPKISKMLYKGYNGTYYVNMQKYGDAGFTWLNDNEFKLLQLAIFAITKQTKLMLDYRSTFTTNIDSTISDDDIINVDDEYNGSLYVNVVWSEKDKEYIEKR